MVDLTRVYSADRRRVIALDGLSLEVREGEVFGLLGPNGAGKTTLVKVLTTMITPTSGSARVLGFAVCAEPDSIRPHIGVSYGGELGLYWRLAGRQNLDYACRLHDMPVRETRQRLAEMLDVFGLTSVADRRVNTYSRGLRQRLHLARALIHRPKVVFLDEPTAGLDPVAAREVREIIASLKDHNRTLLLTTHNMSARPGALGHDDHLLRGPGGGGRDLPPRPGRGEDAVQPGPGRGRPGDGLGEGARRDREGRPRVHRRGEVSPNLKVKEVSYEGRRYVVCLNPEEAGRDAKVRAEALAKLKEKLGSGRAKQLIGNSAFRRYLKLDGAGVSIDTDAVEAEARYDGKYVLRTNSFLSPGDAAQAYKSLWQVERAFRELKSGLDLRPVYHWTPKRIRGHVMVCFLALVLETALRRKLAAVEAEVRYDDLLQHLTELTAVEIHLDGRTYLTRTELTGHAPLAFKALGIRPPAHVTEMPRH